jgi:hypothetical protein
MLLRIPKTLVTAKATFLPHKPQQDTATQRNVAIRINSFILIVPVGKLPHFFQPGLYWDSQETITA